MGGVKKGGEGVFFWFHVDGRCPQEAVRGRDWSCVVRHFRPIVDIGHTG